MVRTYDRVRYGGEIPDNNELEQLDRLLTIYAEINTGDFKMTFRELLSGDGHILLDGAMGSVLQQHG